MQSAPNLCYHYTSRYAAQNIISTGRLSPSAGGVVFLTPDLYRSGAEAANRLAIIGKPAEVRLEIPLNRLAAMSPLTSVQIYTQFGLFREGQGHEFTVDRPIDVRDLAWYPLSVP